MKWSAGKIKRRFNAAADYFSTLEQGQPEIVDVGLMLELLTQAASKMNPETNHFLDLGCGAGLYALKMLELQPNADVTLVDVSERMLEVAEPKVRSRTSGSVRCIAGDMREVDLGEEEYDVIFAGAVLHHLRDADEWNEVCEKLYRALRINGSLWVADIVSYYLEPLQQMMWERYADYLAVLGGKRFSKSMLKFIEKEDSPQPLVFQLDLLRETGFSHVEILHCNNSFAAFGACKKSSS